MLLTEQTPLSDQALRYIQATSMEECPTTMHQQFEMVYIRHGRLHVTIDSMDATLGPGDVALIAPFVRHSYDPTRNVTADILLFSPQLCPQVSQAFSGKKPKTPILHRSQIPSAVLHLMRTTSQLFPLPPGSRETTRSITTTEHHPADLYLSVLLLELVKLTSLVDDLGGNLAATQRILNFCAASFTQDISRETVASACNVSPSTVSQTFARLGTTFREHLNDLRITRAHHLLYHTQKPITEIIYECGYSNQGTFNRNFAAKYGHSPRELRSRQKK